VLVEHATSRRSIKEKEESLNQTEPPILGHIYLSFPFHRDECDSGRAASLSLCHSIHFFPEVKLNVDALLKGILSSTTENILKLSLVPFNLNGLITSGSTVLIFCVYLHQYQVRGVVKVGVAASAESFHRSARRRARLTLHRLLVQRWVATPIVR
jgi:hypothetical protein